MTKALKKILYAEDDESLHKIAKVIIERIGGYELHICSDGQEAVEAVRDFRPDLIILDVMMPRMDGITAYGEMQAIPEARNVPVVFMTARIQPNEVAAYRQLGVTKVIAKPFDPIALPEILEEIWLEHRVQLEADGKDADPE
jgi:two-component system, OmpR family, response regulator